MVVVRFEASLDRLEAKSAESRNEAVGALEATVDPRESRKCHLSLHFCVSSLPCLDLHPKATLSLT